MLTLVPTREVTLKDSFNSKCVSGGGRSLLKAGFAPDLVCREAPRLIAHHEEYREADKSDFALQGCSGMKFEVGGTGSNLT